MSARAAASGVLALLLGVVVAGCDYSVDEAFCGDGSSCVPDANGDDTDAIACPASPGSCSYFPFCGCDADMNCVPVGGKPTCISQGLAGTNERCADDKGCAAGLACESGICRPYCSLTEATSCADGDCVDSGVHDFCWERCDPLDANSCAPQGGCWPYGNQTYGIHFYCWAAGSSVGFAQCNTGSPVCSRGYVCAGSASSPACLKYCNASTGSGCPSGQTCKAGVSGSPAAPWVNASGTKIGYCQ